MSAKPELTPERKREIKRLIAEDLARIAAENAPGPTPAGPEMLDEVRDFIGRYVVLPSEAVADLLALWVLHTWTFEASWATPYLRIVSAAPDSGKTLLLEVLDTICRGGWHAINPSLATLYRKVAADHPTLLLDEMDNWGLDDRKEALGILNAGYKRGAKVPRCTERGELQEFEVFCPKAYAGLDDYQLAPTLLSRSITIRMETKRSSDKVEMWLAPDVEPQAEKIRARCQAWAEVNELALEHRRPDLVGLVNRKAEVWWALLVIGEHVGGAWQDRARQAARKLSAGGDDADALSPQVQLLTDIRAAFGGQTTIFTENLIAFLNGLDESPWGARRHGEGLDPRGLSRALRPFKIRPRTVRADDKTAKGYRLDQFEDAFARYLAPPTAVTPVTSVTNQVQSQAVVTDVTDVTDVEGPNGCTTKGHLDAPDPDCQFCQALAR